MNFFIYKRIPSLSLFVFSVFFVVGYLCSANAEQQKPFSTTLNIKVDAEPEIKANILSYIRQSTHELGDVQIVEQIPEWQFFIVAEKIGTNSREKSNIVLSLIITKPFDRKLFSSLIKEKYKDIFYTSADKLYELKTQIIYTGSRDNIRQICEIIVSEFNTKYIQPARTEYNITNKNIKKLGN